MNATSREFVRQTPDFHKPRTPCLALTPSHPVPYWGCWGARHAHACYSNTAMLPSGNRLFIRALAHLYCIGDPKVAYDWNPSSRPKDIAASLAK